jgi:hypothetical protein
MSQDMSARDTGLASVSQIDIVTAETVATEVPRGPRRLKSPKKQRGRSWLWGISGGGILGALGFVALTFYQQYNDSVVEMQRDLKHFNTTCAELVKKDEFANRTKVFWGRMEKLEKAVSDKSERLLLLEHLLKENEEERKQLSHEVQRLRERLATVEGKQSAVTATPSRRE